MKIKDLQIGQIIASPNNKFYSLILSVRSYEKLMFINFVELTEDGLIQKYEVYDGDLEGWIILNETSRF